MPAWLTIVIAIVGLFSTCCCLVLTIRNIKSSSPSEALRKQQKEILEKLDNDNRRLNHLERNSERMEELDRLLLRSVKGMLHHFSTGNHTDTMKELIGNIDEFLIKK